MVGPFVQGVAMGRSRRRPLIGALLRTPHNAVDEYVYRAFAAAGFEEIVPAYFPIFQHVDHYEGSRIGWLAERAHVRKQTMSHLVDRLVQGGYVEVGADGRDNRAKLVRMTAKGWQVHDLADRTVSALERSWKRRLGAERFELLRELLVELGSISDPGGDRGLHSVETDR